MTVRVKICGITTPADAETAADCGADLVGLNFYPRSPRYITESQAAAILRVLPPLVEPVGLFVEERYDRAEQTAIARGIRTVQVHGMEQQLSGPNRRSVIPAFPVRDRASLSHITEQVQRFKAAGVWLAAVLVDAHVPGLHGGTGKTAPWELLADFYPGVPVILAGGLTPDNVAAAIRIVRPYAVDVASGVESAPGRKDPDKVRRFIENARSAV